MTPPHPALSDAARLLLLKQVDRRCARRYLRESYGKGGSGDLSRALAWIGAAYTQTQLDEELKWQREWAERRILDEYEEVE